VIAALAALVAVGFVYYVLPRIAGFGPTLRRLRGGDLWWLALGVVLEAGSFLGEIVLFRGVFAAGENRISWRISYQISMAGAAATKLLATAGAGGIALTVWALRAVGLSAAEVATGMVCYEILTYAVFMGALAIAGFGVWLGLFAGPAPVGVTLVPACFASAVIVIVLSMLFVKNRPRDSCCGWRSAQKGERRSGGVALPHCRDRFMPACWHSSAWSSAGIPRFSARLSTGDSTSACFGRRFAPSATRRAERW